MLALCWIVTVSSYNSGIIDSNRIKDVFGYNNVCVGFDTTPSRYFAQPLMCLQGFFGIRYATLDTLRADIEWINMKVTRGRTFSYWFTFTFNFMYMVTMLGWGMLLIALPEGNAFTYHFYIY